MAHTAAYAQMVIKVYGICVQWHSCESAYLPRDHDFFAAGTGTPAIFRFTALRLS